MSQDEELLRAFHQSTVQTKVYFSNRARREPSATRLPKESLAVKRLADYNVTPGARTILKPRRAPPKTPAPVRAPAPPPARPPVTRAAAAAAANRGAAQVPQQPQQPVAPLKVHTYLLI